MKVVLLGDLHMGARSGDLDFARYFNKFFSDILFPYMKKNSIKNIIQLGDYFDNQTSVNTTAWKECRPVWVNQLVESNLNMVVLVGNHDIAFRNTLAINTPELILSDIKNFQIVKEPTTVKFQGCDYGFDVVPWICEKNKEEILSFIKKQESSVLIGHFAIEGFPMYKGGTVDKRGLPRKIFDQYSFVFSGHFHSKSSGGNIDYLGIPYEITWADYGDQKGFHVFDTENQTLEFVHNPLTMFEKLVYEEDMGLDIPSIEGKIVKLIVKDRGNLKKYNLFLEKLRSVSLKDLTIDEQVTNTEAVASLGLTQIDWDKDREEYIKKAVEATNTDLKKDVVISYLNDLHNRAMAI